MSDQSPCMIVLKFTEAHTYARAAWAPNDTVSEFIQTDLTWCFKQKSMYTRVCMYGVGVVGCTCSNTIQYIQYTCRYMYMLFVHGHKLY